MDAALKYLGFCDRSEREVERHLDACQYGEVEVMETVERLRELGLVDDARYARDFVGTRLATKPVSRAHLREQLLGHELAREVIDDALAAVSDEMEVANAVAVAEKYLRQFNALDEDARDERTIKRILARGYGYDVAREALAAAKEAALSGVDS